MLFRSASGRFFLEFINTGKAGAVFQVYDYGDKQGPWHFTIEAGKRYVASPWHDDFTTGRYDLAVHGPNGFYRHFHSDPAARAGELKIGSSYDVARGKIVLTLENHGSASRTLYVAQSEVYSLDPGQLRRRGYVLRPGDIKKATWTLSASDHWYDLNVTLTDADTFLYRYAGHLETHKASMTDPAIGQMRL